MRTLLLTLLLLVTASSGWALTPDENTAILKMIEFYISVGDDDTAALLKSKMEAAKVDFGPVPKGANAVCDRSNQRITLRKTALDQLLTKGDDEYAGLVSWCSTFRHELVHLDQDLWSNTTSAVGPWVGGTDECENEAWTEAFQALRDWMEQKDKLLRTLESEHANKRTLAEEATKLKHISKTIVDLANDRPANLGRINVVAGNGERISLEALVARAEKLEKKARVTESMMGEYVNLHDGRYEGDLTGLNGRLVLKIEGVKVFGRLNGTKTSKSLTGIPVKDKVEADVDGTVDVDGNIRAKLEGTISRGKSSKRLTGGLTGTVSGDRAEGKYYLENPENSRKSAPMKWECRRVLKTK